MLFQAQTVEPIDIDIGTNPSEPTSECGLGNRYIRAGEVGGWGRDPKRGEIGGWGRVPFNELYAPSFSTIYDSVGLIKFLENGTRPQPPTSHRFLAHTYLWAQTDLCLCRSSPLSKLERLFSLKRGKRDVRALSFELSKMTPQVGLAAIL